MAKKVQEIRFKTGTEVWFQGKLVKVIAIHFSGNRFVGYTVGDPRDPMHGEHAEQDELKAKDELLFVATVIDHGETCDGHVRKLAQGTIDECKKEIEEDKKLYLKRIPRGCTKCVKPNEAWIYPKDGENNYTDGRIYDVIEITLPKAN